MIIPSSKYPAQTAVDLTNYPHGKARNVSVSGDGTGTPLEKDWVNDVWGWMQALVTAAGITPSGTPETAVTSQLLDATRAANTFAAYGISGTSLTSGTKAVLTEQENVGGFVLSSDTIKAPIAGVYLINVSATINANISPVSGMGSGSTSLKRGVAAQAVGGAVWYWPGSAAFSNAQADLSVSFSCVARVTTPATDIFSLETLSSSGTYSIETGTKIASQLFIQRVK